VGVQPAPLSFDRRSTAGVLRTAATEAERLVDDLLS
jgi:hypothetical protein